MKQTIKRERSHFSQITNELLGDKNLSLKAKGLYAFMYSKDDEWNFTIKSMSKQLKEGVDSIQSGLRELKNNGWLKYTKKADGTGEYFLFIHPQKTEGKIPNRENPNQDNPNLGKSTRISNIDYTSNTKKINKKVSDDKYPFELFWSKYPNKIGKAKCVAKWKKIKDEQKEKILNTIDDFIAYKPFKDYVHPNPLTYLNGERWDDELPKADIRPMEINGRKIAFYTDDGQPVFKKALR